MKQNHYNKTMYACFVGYIVQAIVNNFAPLLFLTFHSQYAISLSRITALVTVNFGLQLLVDLLSIGLVDRIGYRASAVLAHVTAAAGLILLTVLPELSGDPFYGLLGAVIVYAVGGGLLEVLVSPIVEACPSDHKEKAMSLLHSFYCWGHVAVVLISTAFFAAAGIGRWKWMALLWALVPLCNAVAFLKVPIAPLIGDGEKGMRVRELAGMKLFWVLMLLMMCAGACEQAVSQWASTFAEKGLKVNKTVGDLAGPMLFAIFMGSARAFYGKCGERINLKRFMYASGVLCLTAYFLIALVPNPVIGLIGCGLCGMSVGILWPGTFSIASASVKRGGTALFALLALAGDLGCSGGPTLVGIVSGAFGDRLQTGILSAAVFPALLLLGLALHTRLAGKAGQNGKAVDSL
ncbi:MAG: MFS transporter [bacterium]|nr:MFS transporter [bacterium]